MQVHLLLLQLAASPAERAACAAAAAAAAAAVLAAPSPVSGQPRPGDSLALKRAAFVAVMAAAAAAEQGAGLGAGAGDAAAGAAAEAVATLLLQHAAYECRGAALKALQRGGRAASANLRVILLQVAAADEHAKVAARALELAAFRARPGSLAGCWRAALVALHRRSADPRSAQAALLCLASAVGDELAPADGAGAAEQQQTVMVQRQQAQQQASEASQAAAAAATLLPLLEAASAYAAAPEERAAAAAALAASRLLLTQAVAPAVAVRAWAVALRLLEDEEDDVRAAGGAAVAAALGAACLGEQPEALLRAAVPAAAQRFQGEAALIAYLAGACGGALAGAAALPSGGVDLVRRLFDKEADNHHAEGALPHSRLPLRHRLLPPIPPAERPIGVQTKRM